MIKKPPWCLSGEELRVYHENQKARLNETRAWNNSPAGNFLRLANNYFPHVIGPYRHFDKSALIDYERFTHQLSEEDRELNRVILLRLIYVLRGKRGKQIGLHLIYNLTRLADQTGCCVIAVCSPFERFGTEQPHETVEEVAKHFTDSSIAVRELFLERDFKEPQRRMGERFKASGFKQINIEENIGNRKKCTPAHCWIYIPDSCEPCFAKSLTPRLLINP
jgi:GNAT superfamily N-acetyltransferase